MPNYGSARCDLPGGSAAILYDSIQQVNVRAGELPPPRSNGIAYLEIPLDAFGARR